MGMKDNIRVACIVPAHNVDKWLGECLDSLVNQEKQFDEIIVINDGSTDNTLGIGYRYMQNYQNITLISHENRGLGAGRNEGIRESTCDYIMFLDADDMLSLNALSDLYELMDTKPDCVYFDADQFGEKELITETDPYVRITGSDVISCCGKDFFTNCYPNGFVSSACMCAYRRDYLLTNDISFPEGILFEDNSFSFQCMMEANDVIYLPRKLYNRRMRYESIMTSEYDSRKFHDHVIVFGLIYSYVSTNASLWEIDKVRQHLQMWLGMVIGYYEACKNSKIDIDEHKSIFAETLIGYSRAASHMSKSTGNNKVESDIETFQIYSFLLKENLHTESDIYSEYRNIEKWADEYYKRFFNELGLGDSNMKIAFYGVGKRLEAILNVYERLFNKNPDGLNFFDTNKAGSVFRYQRIMSLDEIGGMDKVIVSIFSKDSYLVASEIKKRNPNVEIINLYDSYPRNMFRFDSYLFVNSGMGK